MGYEGLHRPTRRSARRPRAPPAAALFPLLPIDSPEFGELVADIGARGLLQPIVLHEGGSVGCSEIGSALGRLTGRSGHRSRRFAEAAVLAEPGGHKGRPITDPTAIERHRAQPAEGRAVRAERMAVAKEATTSE